MTLGFPLTTLAALLLSSSLVLGDVQGLQERCSGDKQAYTVTVKTGTKLGSGTDDNIYITINDSRCDIGPTRLDIERRNDFESGHIDNFTLDYPPLWNIEQVVLQMEIDPGMWMLGLDWWYPEYVIVTDPRDGRAWRADFNRWIFDEGLEYAAYPYQL